MKLDPLVLRRLMLVLGLLCRSYALASLLYLCSTSALPPLCSIFPLPPLYLRSTPAPPSAGLPSAVPLLYVPFLYLRYILPPLYLRFTSAFRQYLTLFDLITTLLSLAMLLIPPTISFKSLLRIFLVTAKLACNSDAEHRAPPHRARGPNLARQELQDDPA